MPQTHGVLIRADFVTATVACSNPIEQYNTYWALTSDNKTRVATANNKIVIIDFTVENNQFVNRAAIIAKYPPSSLKYNKYTNT